MSGGAFAEWQPRYAEVGIATFPVTGKTPAVRNYAALRLPGSTSLVARFGAASTFGLALERSRIVVLDVDSPDENILADALARHGESPFIVRSGGGNYQAWYRRTNESRQVRPDPELPIDILGRGFVVAPPSLGAKGQYTIIQGTLGELQHLPALKIGPERAPKQMPGTVGPGERNDGLWRHCMRHAHFCDDFEALLDVAHTFNADLKLPLDHAEVLKTAKSAWGYTERGENWFGRQHLRIAFEVVDQLLAASPDAFLLLAVLRRENRGRQFQVANAMAESMPGGEWARKRFAAARKHLESLGSIVEVHPASSYHGPTLYRWGE